MGETMKTILLILLITVSFLLILMPIVSAGELQELSVVIGPERNLPPSGENNIDVAIMAKGIDNISNIQLNLQYNPEVLVGDDITKGDIDAEFSSKIDPENPGNIVIDIEKDTGFSLEEGSIANIKFIVKGGKGKSSPLNLVSLKVLDTSNGIVPVTTVKNAEYSFGRERIVSPIGGPSAQDTTPPTSQNTNPQKTSGFGILISIFILTLIVLLRKRI